MWARIGLSTMAFSTDNRAIDFGFVAGNTVLALVSLDGAVALSKVTHIFNVNECFSFHLFFLLIVITTEQ